MPIYEYLCKDCDQEFEELVFGEQKVSCPYCRSQKTNKLMSRCRHKSGGTSEPLGAASYPGSGSSCSGCSTSSCTSCH
jgi:putative FmdB family regulatory protein